MPPGYCLLIYMQLGLALSVSLRHEQVAGSELNIAGRGATRACADVYVLKCRLADDGLGDVHQQINSGVDALGEEVSEGSAPGRRQHGSCGLC